MQHPCSGEVTRFLARKDSATRYIAGDAHHRRRIPRSEAAAAGRRRTRPITDRVKQSLFDILAPWIEGAGSYDCFAGTGSMGLECLSRGAAHATFFEAHDRPCERLKKNIATLGVADRSTLVPSDLFRGSRPPSRSRRADLVFLDPPYRFLRSRRAGRCDASPSRSRHSAPRQRRRWCFGTTRRRLARLAQLIYDPREYGGMVLEFPLTRWRERAAGVTSQLWPTRRIPPHVRSDREDALAVVRRSARRARRLLRRRVRARPAARADAEGLRRRHRRPAGPRARAVLQTRRPSAPPSA